MESTCGKDPRWKIPGPAGELGEYRIRPIFIEEVLRITGGKFRIDPFNNISCREGIARWLEYSAPPVGATTTEELYELYRRGPAGYRRWKGGLRCAMSPTGNN